MTLRPFPLVLAAMLVAGCADTEGEAPEFDRALAAHLAAVTGRDLAALEPPLADDVAVIFPDGSQVEGKRAVLDFHREWFADP